MLNYWFYRKNSYQEFIKFKLMKSLNSLSLFLQRDCFCPCNKLISSFLPHLSFKWRTFSRRVTARWWRQWAKIQLWTNQNSRNNWYQIVTQTAFKDSIFAQQFMPPRQQRVEKDWKHLINIYRSYLNFIALTK